MTTAHDIPGARLDLEPMFIYLGPVADFFTRLTDGHNDSSAFRLENKHLY